MTWPTEAGILTRPYPRRFKRRRRPRTFSGGPIVQKHGGELLGRYRIFAPGVYRFYRSNTGPPVEGDAPFATNATVPHEPADTYADGTWWLSASYFNGLVDSGFLPLGPAGETWLRLDLSGGEEIGSPPAGPLDVRLETAAGGVVRIVAIYSESGTLRAGEWTIGYTINGSDPPEDPSGLTVAFSPPGMAVLDYALPAQADETTVKVRVQTRRNDGTVAVPVWRYSEGSTVLTIAADASTPSAPLDASADAIEEET